MGIDWYERLRGAKSLGMLTADPGSLAGLHEARRQHKGQFFTPDSIARFMWNLVDSQLEEVYQKGEGSKVAVFDNSVGSGRLLQFCDPAKHVVGGVDVDADAIAAVQEVFEGAGFECDFRRAGMETIRARGWSVALINPPFSVMLNSVLMEPFGLNTFGKLGPGTSAQSDYYAIAQSLEAAMAVVALVPRTVAEKLWRDPSIVEDAATADASRLVARFDLPSGSFEDEGAHVQVSILVFGSNETTRAQMIHKVIESTDEPQPLPRLGIRVGRSWRLTVEGINDSEPTIMLPVTNNKVVKLGHDGRRLRLKFDCGWTQARVMNSVLRQRIVSDKDHRLPDGYRYAGQGALSVDVHLIQEDPEQSLRDLIKQIESADAEVQVLPGFWQYIRMRTSRLKRALVPMSHTVWQKAIAPRTVSAVAKKTLVLDKGNWASPVIRAGTKVEFTRTDDAKFETKVGATTLLLNFEELDEKFQCAYAENSAGWTEIYAGKSKAYADQAKSWFARLSKTTELSFLSWKFQRDDLVELLLCPRGCIVAWAMGTGKTRLAVALILLSGVKHGLVTTEAYLVPEFVDQLEKLGLDRSLWQVIRKPEDLSALKKINIISNQLLRMGIRSDSIGLEDQAEEKEEAAGPKAKRVVTYAHKLRRRIGMAISDEGEYLANPTSQRSRALWRVSAKRRYVLSGTPVPNTPRDMLPILCYVGGDGVAEQPWGYRGPYLEANHRKSVQYAERGIAKFIDSYVELAWVVNEFSETLRDGAKREIPSIRNVQAYRSMIAPYMKRRVTTEPEVQAYVQIPKANERITNLAWESGHLSHYLTVCDEFASWFGREASAKKNLMVILLRFQAVVRALNIPQLNAKHVKASYRGTTSKQQYIVDRAVELTEQRRKTLIFVQSPDLASLLAQKVDGACGVRPLVIHGGLSISTRYELLRDHYRNGKQAVVLATFGVTQAGLNLPETQNIIMGSRMMTAKAERQAIARALRPETRHEVDVEYVHIAGSADEYLHQMVEFKGAALDEALDWASPKFESDEYQHMDTIIGRFVSDLAERKGIPMSDLKEMLKQAA